MNNYQLENEIQKLIINDNNCSTHFEYDTEKINNKEYYCLRVITFNPKHKTHFMLYEDKLENDDTPQNLKKKILLTNAIGYIKHTFLSSEHHSYTVVWKLKGDSETHTSYFHGNNLLDVCRKFYLDKKQDEYVIYEVKMNPDS